MTTNALFALLIDSLHEANQTPWTIARLNVQFLGNGEDIEFSGTYLDPEGEDHPLSTDFHEDVTEAMQRLYQNRKRDGHPRFNHLQLDLAATGQYTTAYSWDQEVQDEEDHFNNGGTARDWQAIREAKYGKREGE